MTLSEIRRRLTLPGRFQPSTISVLRLNFCVRDGNRWIPQAIVTGNQAELGFSCFRPRSRRLSQFLPHPQNRTGPILCFRLTTTSASNPRHSPNHFTWSQVSFPAHSLRFRSFCSLFPFPCYLLPRSSPRPISITKLHTLLHFHR